MAQEQRKTHKDEESGLSGLGHCHECAPREWRRTPVVTGSYELDAGIARNGNGDMRRRLRFYAEPENAYGPRTGYDGYHNYGGDS